MGGDWVANEFGVTCSYPENFSKKLGNQWNVTKKLWSSRTFSILAISQLIEEFEGVGMTAITCLDAIPSMGISGFIWKKIFGSRVAVTVNTTDEEAIRVLNENMKRNDLETDSLTLVHEDPNSLLHKGKKYNFVYLEAYGTAARYLEAACRTVCHRGIICIVSTDLSTLYNKCPARVSRIYAGHIMKQEYDKELSLRLIVANVIRAASRWDKGISVLSSHYDEDSVTIVVRILKGATHADACLSKIQKVAHCRICNDRSLVPEKLYYSPKHGVVSCLCQNIDTEDGAVAAPIVLLGPVATVPIFDTPFLLNMTQSLCRLNPTSKMITIMKNIVLESMCFDSEQSEAELNVIINDMMSKSQLPEPPCKKFKNDALETINIKYGSNESPIFYFVGQNHTRKGHNPPKIQLIIQELRSQGYRASRTLFDPRGVRTSASTKQFNSCVDKISKETN